MFWLNFAAILSGIFCLCVFARSIYVALQLKHINEACGYKAWNEFVVCYNGLARPATRLLFEFHLARWLTFASLIVIVAGFVLSPTILDEVFKENFGPNAYQSMYQLHVNNLLSGGIIIGWICSFSTFRYFPLVDKKLIKRQ